MQRIDVFLQYYRPHISGLTNMAAVIAEYAAAHGYDMHVHAVAPKGDTATVVVDGVTVHTYRRSFSLGRGAFSFALLWEIWRMRKSSGIAHVHMPYPESFYLAWVLRRDWKIIATYQCDAPLSGGFNTFIAKALDWSHTQLIKRANATVTSSEDYAACSRLRKVINENRSAVVPVTGMDRAGGTPRYAVPGRRLIGFMGRPTFEKGINVLLEALSTFPLDDVSLLFAGPVSGLTEKMGYDAKLLSDLIDQGRVIPVGFLEEEEIADFFASLDAYVHPSINSFEAFGIVQIEAMSAGIPVIASDMPGVRTAVWATGFGEITLAGDAADLRRGMVKVLEGNYDATHARAVLEGLYLPPRPQEAYRELYAKTVEQPPRR